MAFLLGTPELFHAVVHDVAELPCIGGKLHFDARTQVVVGRVPKGYNMGIRGAPYPNLFQVDL